MGDVGSIPGSGRSPGEEKDNPVQYSCLETPMDGGAWWATVHEVAKSRTQLSDFTFTFSCRKHPSEATNNAGTHICIRYIDTGLLGWSKC